MDAAAWDERYLGVDRLWSATPNIFVADRLGAHPPGAGLDLGSGEGRNAVWLAQRGWRMTAVDFSRVAIERGTAAGEGVEFIEADVTTWTAPRDYDLVLIAYLHLPGDVMRSVVGSAAGWLRPGGELFMVGHDRSNLELGHGGPQAPEILWEVHELTEWLDGLPILEAQTVRRPVETDDGFVYARDALIRARKA